jgi:hypothetical protein
MFRIPVASSLTRETGSDLKELCAAAMQECTVQAAGGMLNSLHFQAACRCSVVGLGGNYFVNLRLLCY